MAVGDGAAYNVLKKSIMNGTVDLDSDTLKACLVIGYTPDIDAHTVYDDVSIFEVSGTGYTDGGKTLAALLVLRDDANDKSIFDAEDVEWAGLDVGALSHVVLYDDTPVTKPLVAYWELTAPALGADYTIQWGAGGILTLE